MADSPAPIPSPASASTRLAPRLGAQARCPRPPSKAQGAVSVTGSVKNGAIAVTVPIHFHPLHFAGLQAHRRVVAGHLAVLGAGGVHQCRLSSQHPLAPQLGVGPEVGLVDKEYLRVSASRQGPKGGILRHEVLTLGLTCFDQPLLGTLEGEAQPVRIVQATTPAQADTESFRDKLTDHLPIPVCQSDARGSRSLLHCRLQLLLSRLVKGGGEPPLCSKIRRCWPSFPKGRSPSPYCMRVPFQGLHRGRCRQALGQQQHCVPPFPFPGRRRQDRPPPQVLGSHPPLFQRPVYLPHAHHQPPQLPTPVNRFHAQFTLCFCAFHLDFVLALRPAPGGRPRTARSGELCHLKRDVHTGRRLSPSAAWYGGNGTAAVLLFTYLGLITHRDRIGPSLARIPHVDVMVACRCRRICDAWVRRTGALGESARDLVPTGVS